MNTAPARAEPGRRRWLASATALLVALVAVPAAWWLLPHDRGAAAIAGWHPALNPPPNEPAAAQAAARAVLRSAPVNGQAFRVLAQNAEADSPASQALWAQALAWAPRDIDTRAALADQALEAGNPAAALQHLDALMRVQPALRAPLLEQMLLPELGNPALRTALLDHLQADPPWRPHLATLLARQPQATAGAEALWQQLAERGPLAPAELQAWQQQRRLAGDAAGAYQLWREHLPATLQPHLGTVFDGGFEAEPGNTPYHWQWPRQAGVAIVRDDSHAQDGQHSLRVEFAGRSLRFEGPRQTLGPLPAGTYRLQASADNRTGNPRPFQWQLHCGRQLLATLALADSPGWQNRQQGFVLATPCNEPVLRLGHTGRTVPERVLRGSLWLDAVQITRQDP